MEKDYSLAELFDLYGELLTDRQKELFESYYLFDLSLSEIAEPEGKTRQNVYEQVKKVKKKLCELDKKLSLKEKFDSLTIVAQKLKNEGNPLGEKILEIIGK